MKSENNDSSTENSIESCCAPSCCDGGAKTSRSIDEIATDLGYSIPDRSQAPASSK